MPRLSYLIVGGDGLIGSSLHRKLILDGASVTVTTRKHPDSSNSLYLNLNEDVSAWRAPLDVQVAYLCAAITKIKTCDESHNDAYRVNVESTLQIAAKLLEGGTFVVFLSTNYVFSGSKPQQKTNDSYAPINEYGRLKAEAERRLLSLGGKIAIVRLTKVLDRNSPLIAEWIRNLKRQQPVYAFHDLCIAPISLTYAVDALYHIGKLRKAGVYHLSGSKDLSYADLARMLANKVGVSRLNVNETSCRSNPEAAVARNRYMSLDVTETRTLLDIEPQTAVDVIEELAN
jgi:dTDP-4-dehydrorhamnose reductase